MIGFLRKTRTLGARGEALAAKALKANGYTILERNVDLGRYEIDIIAREGDTIAFVEVKTRTSDHIAFPEDNVTFEKRRHISRAARRYIDMHPEEDVSYRFDVVAVLVPDKGKPDITIYRDAFREDDS